MITVGLTGNIGSGKSTIAGIFEVLGVPVYHSDAEAKKILDLPEVGSLLKGIFGEGLFTDGFINRKKLAELVFNDQDLLEKLNSVIHPRVKEDFEQWLGLQQGHSYVVQEAAILFESGFYKLFDKIVLVRCPEEIAISRVMKRDQIGESEVRARIQNQWPEAKKTSLSDFIIHNDGAALVIPQVLKIHKLLLE